MTTTRPQLQRAATLPDIGQAKGIYAEIVRDRNPNIKAAGKLTATGDNAEMCLMPPQDRPQSAEVIRRFRASYRPDAGETRVFYGKAYDPHLRWAKDMTHGINTYPSQTSGEIVNPPPKSLFQQRLLDRKELLYASHLRAPLGRSSNQAAGLPKNLDPYMFTFGLPTELDIGAGGLINPNKTYDEIEKEFLVGKHLYKKTHCDFEVGEKVCRNYSAPSFKSKQMFGIPTPHDNDGRLVKKTLKWSNHAQTDDGSKVVSKRVDDFRERTQPQLGKVHDPIKDTLNVPDDHIFGILFKPDEYGAGDLIHNRGPGTYLRGKDHQRGVLAAVRQHLKKMNYHNFSDLLAAFKHYDKDSTGKIDITGLREACIQFNLPIEPELLEQLMDYCDGNHDGFIDYVEFANFLNWKGKMPSGVMENKDVNVMTETGPAKVVGAADMVPKSSQSRESTPRRLQKEIDRAIGNHRTSASMVNAVVGGVSTRNFRKYGVPTIRTDIPAPRIKRIEDRTNYGEESDAFGLLNPSIYSHFGVYEKDFLKPRSSQELKDIFSSLGIMMTADTFDRAYQRAAMQHPRHHVSVESFRSVLDDVHAMQISSYAPSFQPPAVSKIAA